MTPDAGMDVHDYVRDLTRTHTHRERYTTNRGGTTYTRDHVTTVAPLLTQLWASDTPSSSTEEGPRPGYASRPAARLEALDVAVRIDLAAARWVRDLGHDDPVDTTACIRLLASLLPNEPRETQAAIERDIRSWWTQARIVTGWDSPPWRPDNTCPMCSERGTLRVNLALQAGMCVECRETWDQTNIGLLADHIRGESEAEKPAAADPVPCVCPWPHPGMGDRWGVCPACGSAACVHALAVAAREDEARAVEAEARAQARSRRRAEALERWRRRGGGVAS